MTRADEQRAWYCALTHAHRTLSEQRECCSRRVLPGRVVRWAATRAVLSLSGAYPSRSEWLVSLSGAPVVVCARDARTAERKALAKKARKPTSSAWECANPEGRRAMT